MSHFPVFFSFSWLEGSRFFDVGFGLLTSATCLALAIPILTWCLPNTRKRLFSEKVDPRGLFQLSFGILCMSMAFADALCRYIPHRPLGFVHPAFFITTVALFALLGPVISRSSRREFVPIGLSSVVLAAVLIQLAAAPLAAVVNAFWS